MFLVQMNRPDIFFFDAYLYMIKMTFLAQLVQYQPERGRSVSFALISLVNHKLLQIISDRLIGKLSYKCNADDNPARFYNEYSGITVAIDISSCYDSNRRRKEIFLIVFHG